jgi:4-hydroxy-tetrahydrodipicolinate reductase
MIRLVVHGASGRMGRRLCALIETDVRFDLSGAFDRPTSSVQPTARDENPDGDVDVVIDFSSDDGARRAAAHAARYEAALLVGTTGLSAGTLDVLGDLARSVPIMIAPNTSRGVAVMTHLVAEATRLLGSAFEVDLVEEHHHHKRDAPSGTALRLVEAVERRRAGALPPDRVHCVRAGEIIGEHEVRFSGSRERIKISHSALDRDLFAAGALDAAAWLAGRPAGQYRIDDVLGLG